MPLRLRSTALAALLALTGLSHAQGTPTPGLEALRAAAQSALSTSPDVAARLNALRAAGAATDAARGGLLPRVDLEATVGRTHDRITSRTPEGASLGRHGAAVSVTQVLWDAHVIRSDIERAGHEQRARWFEFVDASETTVLEAARALHDVMRQRTLVALAEDNYVQHKVAATQIGSRVRAGVARGVDQEQAQARLALAEANLSVETANLHDVTARYQRIVGELPPARIARMAPGAQSQPASAGEAATLAIRHSPAVSAAIENLRAARAASRGREGAAWQPRVEARLRSGTGRNFDGVPDQKRDTSAEVTLNWNLYNGGSDQARIAQAASLQNQAADVRDRVCRDTRQSAAIAFNDTRKYAEQIEALDRNVIAIEKARDAYRQQFDIGQRSLLDLLNAENELYTARRALANAEHDLLIAQSRSLAAVQRLSSTLGLTRPDAGVDGGAGWSVGDDAPARCPVVALDALGTTGRAALDARASSLIQQTPAPR
ncbi:MAG TPA: TolC family outer membrane protein [Burkholderiaceae bacterium]|nr:TolC family outer membrane protein [Burkholderiaceae bacterium]